MQEQPFKFSASVIWFPFLTVLTLWIVFWAGVRFHLDLETLGIYPRSLDGLKGVLLSPLIHGNIEHLYNNSIPLLMLLAALRFFYRDQTFFVLGYGWLLTGFITWVIGRASYHIGASSLVYLLVGFIFFKGINTRYFRLVALSFVVVLTYGSLVWYIFPNVKEGISWEGHLAGLLVGLVFAYTVKTPDFVKEYRYEWEHPDYDASQDKFMQRFDENGNFVNLPPPESEIIEPEILPSLHSTSTSHQVYFDAQRNVYVIQPKKTS